MFFIKMIKNIKGFEMIAIFAIYQRQRWFTTTLSAAHELCSYYAAWDHLIVIPCNTLIQVNHLKDHHHHGFWLNQSCNKRPLAVTWLDLWQQRAGKQWPTTFFSLLVEGEISVLSDLDHRCHLLQTLGHPWHNHRATIPLWWVSTLWIIHRFPALFAFLLISIQLCDWFL